MSGRIFTGATFHAADGSTAGAMLVRDGLIAHLGDLAGATACDPGAEVVRLGGGHVLPGFVDAHAHLLHFGASRRKADLHDAASLDDIVDRVRALAAATPGADRLQGQGWMHSMLDGRRPHRGLLDEHFGDVPVYLGSHDVHSMWVNSAALAELGIHAGTVAAPGGVIERDDDGSPTGLLAETVVQTQVWPRLVELTSCAEARADLLAGCAAFVGSGVTSVVDMAFGEHDLSVLGAAGAAGELPLRVDAHWLVPAGVPDPPAEVARAAEVAAQEIPGGVRVVGIKIIADGVIDACTAAMRRPFADGSRPDPIWTADDLVPVVAAADRAGLAVAVHAIGDAAVDVALDAFETALGPGPHRARHRIEHLEVADRAQLARLARLGLTASMQPVHADPAIQDTWRANLADEERIGRGYPWRHAEEAGALLAFGSDAPTAPHPPLANVYVASTRCSAQDPRREPNHPELAVDRAAALRHASLDAATAGAHDDRGALEVGRLADFVVVDADPLTVEPRELLTIGVRRTVIGGTTVFAAP